MEANVMIFLAVLVPATFLCSLVAGLLFAFAVVVMPGIRSPGRRRLHAGVSGNRSRDPEQSTAVCLVWVGSVVALIAAAALGMWALSGTDSVTSDNRSHLALARPHERAHEHEAYNYEVGIICRCGGR
jgi:hypothetical protein